MPIPQVNANLDFGPLNEELLIIARKQGEDPDRICAIIEEFRDMIFERGDCVPHTTDSEYLIRFLRARFWKPEHSYNLLRNYHNFRNENKELHEKVNPNELRHIGDADIVSVAPYKDQNGRRLVFYRLGNWIPEDCPVNDIIKTTLIIQEIGALEPSGQILGATVIYDMSNLSLQHILNLTPSVAQIVFSMLVTSMPARTNEIHIINQNWLFNTVYSIFKPFLNAKMKKRIFIHGDDMTSLHKHIAPENLPKRYGGIHDDYSYTTWIENLSKDEKVVKELRAIGYVIIPDQK